MTRAGGQTHAASAPSHPFQMSFQHDPSNRPNPRRKSIAA
jgi:hypothetical protein